MAGGGGGGGGFCSSISQFHTSTDILEFTEYLGQTREVFTEDELCILEGDSISNKHGIFSYYQYFEFPYGDGLRVLFSEDKDRATVEDHLTVEEDAPMYTYNLEFPTPLESDIDANNDLDDLEQKTMTILGKTFTITNTHVSSDDGDIQLELAGGYIFDLLYEAETKTYLVAGKEYEVTVIYIGSISGMAKVKFQINYDNKTEITPSLGTGELYLLEDNTGIGVEEVLLQNDPGGAMKDFVEFYLQADKLVLEDLDFTNQHSGSQPLEMGYQTIQEIMVDIVADNSTYDMIKIAKIQFDVASPQDIYVPMNGLLSDELEEKEILLIRSFDFFYKGLSTPPSEKVEFLNDGNSRYKMKVSNKAGEEIQLPVWNVTIPEQAVLGDYNGILYTKETCSERIGVNDYFILGDGSEANNIRDTYLVKYKDYNSTTKEIQFEDVGMEETLVYFLDEDGKTNIMLGGKQFLVNMSPYETGRDNGKIWVDFDASGDCNEITMNWTLASGIWIEMPSQESATDMKETTEFNFHVPPENLDDEIVSDNVRVELEAYPDGEADIGGIFDVPLAEVDSTDFYTGYSEYGIFVENMRPVASPNTANLTIPFTQIEPLVYIFSGEIPIPILSDVEIFPKPAYEDDTLLCLTTGEHIDYWHYRWYNNGELIAGQNSNTLSSIYFTENDEITCDAYGVNSILGLSTDTLSDSVFILPIDIDLDDDGYNSTVDCDDENSSIHPGAPELCNGIDEDCDGLIDEDWPELGTPCDGVDSDLCLEGSIVCIVGGLGTECSDDTGNNLDYCDGMDNDCNPGTSDGSDEPTLLNPCDTGLLGVCAQGEIQCNVGMLGCVQTVFASAEICDVLDNDCDGSVDEGDPEGGAPCDTGLQGICAQGTMHCQGGSLSCVQDNFPVAEVCNGLDDDCDGEIDEDCNCPYIVPDSITVHSIDQNDEGIADNTYEHGWRFTFNISVPDNELNLQMRINDWVGSYHNITTNNNIIIDYKGKNFAVGSSNNYNESQKINISDEMPECAYVQTIFDVIVKLPTDTIADSYITSYGILSS